MFTHAISEIKIHFLKLTLALKTNRIEIIDCSDKSDIYKNIKNIFVKIDLR